jgi:GR25 family glycosyltransferase involved in LPS biosynthesis
VTVHVINLDRDTERLRTFMELNAHLPDITRVAAVDGRSADRASLRALGTISGDLNYSDANLGCALSHIGLWRKALKENRALTIAEDDARFSRVFPLAHDRMIRDLPADWGCILWGWNFDALLEIELIEGVARSILRLDQSALRANIDTFRNAEIVSLPFRLHHAFGLMGYSVSPSGAKAMLETCLPLSEARIKFGEGRPTIRNGAIDAMTNAVYPAIKAYVCVPPLAVSENRRETSRTQPDT